MAIAAAGRRAAADERAQRLLCVLFFLAGFPALIYQLIWQRALFRIFGVNIEAVTIVVTAFMLGLGLGSLAGGWLSRRRVPLLLLLASIELLTGAFGVLSLGIFEAVGDAVFGWPPAATAFVTLALVIVPTLLMGATLPVLVGHLVLRSGNVGGSVGLLYYVNTLGAGAACIVSALLLFPRLGMQTSVLVAAAMNGSVALGALVAFLIERRRGRLKRGNSEAAAPVAARLPHLSFAAVLSLSFFGGWTSLSFEIFFFRTVSYATASSAIAFAVTLGAFLLGLASGAQSAADACRRLAGDALLAWLARALAVANLCAALFLPLLNHLAWQGTLLVGVTLALIYMVARQWGVLLPGLAHLGIAADGRAGVRTAQLYLFNILGAAIGCVLTGFVLTERLTLVGIAQLLVSAGLSCTAVLIACTGATRQARSMRMATVAGVGGAAVALIPAGASDVLEALLYKGQDRVPFRAVVENRSGIIAVDQKGAVFGNGIYDGHFNVDLLRDTNGVVRPYALSLYHSAPREVLMIGFASGSWAQVIANHPQVQRLTIVEINPGYQSLVARTPTVASVLAHPKVTLIADDGRRWLRAHPERRFDAIVSNTSFHFRANATNLLSSDFLELIKQRLAPGGTFFYNTTDSSRVQRTGCSAFPYGARFMNHMLVSASPIQWDFDRWRETLLRYSIDGRPVIDPSSAAERDQLMRLTSSFQMSLDPEAQRPETSQIEPCPDVLARTQGDLLVTDDNMGTEWGR